MYLLLLPHLPQRPRNPKYNLTHIDLDFLHRAQSLFQIMGFKKQMRTTGKVEIPEGARKEAELLQNHHDCRDPSFINHEFEPHSLKVHTYNESHYGKTKL